MSALHRPDIVARNSNVVRIAVIGATGRVGRLVVSLVRERGQAWQSARLTPRLVFAANSRGWVYDESGVDAADIHARVDAANWPVLSTRAGPLVIVDCTASADIAARYPEWLARGIHVVTPNKYASSSDTAVRSAIDAACAKSGAAMFDSTTVGAQLPLLSTLRELRCAGDRVERFEAVLSGTLSYVLGSVQDGKSLSQSIAEAVALGYAEPDPARDLSGEDAARKLVILLRSLGVDIDLRDVERLPLLETGEAGWVEAAAALDESWRARAALAHARREKWVYRASFENGRARIAPERIAADHPLARLAPCENAIVLHSDLYRAAPLTIAGPGAGIELTAAGVFADLLTASRSCLARAAWPYSAGLRAVSTVAVNALELA
jgi:bifunctional aspartokinase / homoserine dehydrogenase 1